MARVEIDEVIFDDYGALAAGATVEIRVRVSQGIADVFVEETGVDERDNPLLADGKGRIEGWVEEGTYYDITVSGENLTTRTQPWLAPPRTTTGGPHAASHAPGQADALSGLTAVNFAASHRDGLAAVESLRSLGAGAQQAASGTAVGLRQLLSEKNQANGYAGLDVGGKVVSSSLPAISISTVQVVASQAAQLALTAEEGDVAVRTDSSRTYMRNSGTAGTMADWTELVTPTSGSTVISVAGKTGVVLLVKDDVGLANVDNTSDANKPVSTAQQTALDLKQALSEKGAANGYAGLDAGGKVQTSSLPALAITGVTVVASQAAQLALTAQEGDVAVRSDQSKSYVHNGGVAGTMADWTELQTPGDLVLSVAGKTGVVTLVKADVGLGNVDNTTDAAKPVSTAQQTALDLKEDESHLAASGKGYVNHGATAGTARPSGYASVEWTGSVTPTNAVNGDTWIDTT